MADKNGTIKKLQKRAAQAKKDLAYLAAIHWGVRSTEHASVCLANSILQDPSREFSEMERRLPETGKRCLDAFKAFSEYVCPQGSEPTDNAGHYLNKSAILYADAIIQAFLDDTYHSFSQGRTLKGRTVEKKLGEIKDKLKNSSNYEEVCSSKHVKLISQLRHVITHKSGIVDKCFATECTKNCGLFDRNIWSDAEFLHKYQPGNQVSLPWDEVIIPYLKHAFDFIDDHTNQLISCLNDS